MDYVKMKKVQQKLCPKFSYPTLRRNRKGLYAYGGHKLPSVTTVLNATKDTSFLKTWIERVGVEQAEKIKNDSATVGNSLHKTCEFFLKNKMLHSPKNSLESKGYEMGYKLINTFFKNINEVWGSEVSIYYPEIYAGTIDMVGVYDGEPTVIDFKQANKPKKEEWVDDYFHQLAAYAMAHDRLFKTEITTGRVLMAVQDGSIQEFVLKGSDLENYKLKFLQRVKKAKETVDC